MPSSVNVGGIRTSTIARSGLQFVDDAQQVGRIGHAGDHVVPGVGEDALDARPQQRGVLGDHDAHGSTAVTMVGPVAGLDTVKVPRAARTRSSSPRRPVASVARR